MSTDDHPDGVPALIALGSNLGDREAALHGALEGLAAADVRVVRVSRMYETEPVGGPAQGLFLNAAAVVHTSLAPLALLRLCQSLERAAGRSRQGPRWGPRPLDLDLLLYGDRVIDHPDLTVPHPRMTERRFVLEPAADVADDWVHPTDGRTLAELLEALP